MERPLSILAIDIGGTKTIVGVADAAGNVITYKRIETPGAFGPDRVLADTKALAHEIIGEARVEIDSIGIGCGGPLDRDTGTLYTVPNLPGWEGVCLKKEFGDEFRAPVYVDNDATAATLGELMFGAGRGYSNFVYMNCSTGIGGGIVIDGKPYRGHNGNAGEFGHHKLTPEGPKCTCGDRGCLEAYSSGTSIAREAREGLPGAPDSLIWQWISSADDVTAEMVAKATAQGDEFASRIWNEAVYMYGVGVANIVNILNPELVVLAGGVINAGELFFEPVRRVVSERAMKALADVVEIVPAENGDLMGLMGAIALAIERA